MKVIVFCAGLFGKRFYNECENDIDIIAFADNDPNKIGKLFCGHPIIDPKSIPTCDYDKIVISIDDTFKFDNSHLNVDKIIKQLCEYGVEQSKIFLTSYLYIDTDIKRIEFIRDFSSIINIRKIPGAAAECGVYRGHYASYINKYLPNRKLYLFDTFGTGFVKRDLDNERYLMPESQAYKDLNKWAIYANAEISRIRCWHQEQVIIKAGYVPDTFEGLEDERFCFVNLDMDLYEPQLSALRFFAPRMSKGGVILVHEYFDDLKYVSVKPAVEEFAKEYPITSVPIGDNNSLAIIPHNS